MSWARKHLGLDWFNLFVHVGVTSMLMAWVGVANGPEELFPIIVGSSLVLLAVHRNVVLARDRRTGVTNGERAAERIEELEQRVAELEAAQGDVADLAERLDFAERLMSQMSREPDRIGKGSP